MQLNRGLSRATSIYSNAFSVSKASAEDDRSYLSGDEDDDLESNMNRGQQQNEVLDRLDGLFDDMITQMDQGLNTNY